MNTKIRVISLILSTVIVLSVIAIAALIMTACAPPPTSDAVIPVQVIETSDGPNVHKYIDDEFNNVCYIYGSSIFCMEQ